MNLFKKSVAILLAVAFIFTLSACHPKDEVAISAGDYEITSAMYSYFLVAADNEAKTLIKNAGTYDTTATGFKYIDQTIDGKSYTDYVKEKALEACLRYITIVKLCDEAGVTLDAETEESWKNTASYYWYYAGYGSFLPENGVQYSTFEKVMLNNALYNAYFDHLYLEGGEKEMSKADIQSNFDSHYSAVYMIGHDYSTEKEPDLDKIKADMEKYKKLFEKGKTLEEVQAVYDEDHKKEEDKKDETSSGTSSGNSSNNSSSGSSNTSSNNSSNQDSSNTTSSEEKEEEKKPLDKDITILTDYEDTSGSVASYFTKYAEVDKLEQGKAAVIADSDDKMVYVVYKKDINADPYYLEELTSEIVYMVHGEGFDNSLKEEAKKLDYTVNNYAVDRFKVKKIKDGTES